MRDDGGRLPVVEYNASGEHITDGNRIIFFKSRRYERKRIMMCKNCNNIKSTEDAR